MENKADGALRFGPCLFAPFFPSFSLPFLLNIRKWEGTPLQHTLECITFGCDTGVRSQRDCAPTSEHLSCF